MVLQIHQEEIQQLSPEHFPWALLYRGAVPWETIEACSGRAIWPLLEQIIEHEEWCLAQRDTLSDQIFAHIGSLSEEQAAQRRQTIRLRRDLYNLQTLIKQEEIQVLQTALAPDVQRFLHHYWQRSQQLHALKQQAQEQLQQTLAQGRTQLWGTVQETPALLKGIALIAPELYDQAQRFQQPTFKRKASRLEKEEISLLLYLVRTATKTSAFSTFTSVALAYTEIGTQGQCQLQVADETQASVASVNHLPLVLLTHALTRQPALRQHLRLRVNPYCVEEDGHYKIIRTANYRATMRNYAYTQAEKITLPTTALLTDLLAHTRASTSTPYSLAQWLQERMQISDEEKAARFIERLLEMQMLLFDLEGLQTRTIVQDVRDQLAALPEQVMAPYTLVEALNSIDHDQQTYPHQSPPQRVETERRIVSSIERCFEEVGGSIDRRARVLEPPLYESSVLPRRDIRLSLPNTPGLMEDFQLIASIMPFFDTKAILKTILTTFFTQTYGVGGTCPDLLQFLLKLRQTFPDNVVEYMTGSLPPAQQITPPEALKEYLGGTQEMLELRTSFLETLLQSMHAADEELCLDRDWLRRMAAQIPPAMRGQLHQHYAYMCQSVPQSGGDLLVINNISNGWGRQIGVHAANLIQALEGQQAGTSELHMILRQNIAQLSLPGHEFVEIITTQGFNGNIHPLFTTRALVGPGEWCDLPAEQQITLHDLVLTHDPKQNSLHLLHRQDGTEVHLLYMGLLFPGFLGPLQRWLQPFTSAFMWSDSFLLATFMGASEQEAQAVLRYPRIRLGQLILSRRKWIMDAEQWPQWDSRKLPDTAQLLEIERWRRQTGLPAQVYIRPISRRTKPQFVDFHHLLLMAALPKRLQGLHGKMKVEEALPAPTDYHLTREGKHVTSSFWIELRSVKGA